MAEVLAQVRMPQVSGLPEDVIINTFTFRNVDVTDTDDCDAIATALTNAYGAIDQHLSVHIAGPGEVRFYDLAQPEPRVPFHIGAFSVNTSGNVNSLPKEVALCLSFQAPAESGQPQARRRGRVFVGPFRNSTTTTITAAGLPHAQLIADMLSMGNVLLDASNAALWAWCVHSRVGNTFLNVSDGWVDNAFDTQRRRGDAPTTRTTWDGAP